MKKLFKFFTLIQINLFCLFNVTNAWNSWYGPLHDPFNASENYFDPQYLPQERIVSLHNFQYKINPEYDLCGTGQKSDKVFLLVYVHTSPENQKRRITIRETWARRSLFEEVRIVFMMGVTNKTENQDMIKLESNLYNDIVQENFFDSYRNLTYKGIMAMKWISTYCNHAKYILKTDDDIVTNTFKLLRYLKSLKDERYQKSAIICSVWTAMDLNRNPISKWYIPREDWSGDYYTKYCSGSAYILSGDIPVRLFDISLYIKFYWVDDFFMTGILPHTLKIAYHDIGSEYSFTFDDELAFTSKNSKNPIFGHVYDPMKTNKMIRIWNHVYSIESPGHFSKISQNLAIEY